MSMSDPITGYTPVKTRCVECRKITRDPRVGPNGFCCAHCITRAHLRVALTEVIDVYECAMSNGHKREPALREATKVLNGYLVAHSPTIHGTKAETP